MFVFEWAPRTVKCIKISTELLVEFGERIKDSMCSVPIRCMQVDSID